MLHCVINVCIVKESVVLIVSKRLVNRTNSMYRYVHHWMFHIKLEVDGRQFFKHNVLFNLKPMEYIVSLKFQKRQTCKTSCQRVSSTFALACLPWLVDFKTYWSELAIVFLSGQVDFKTNWSKMCTAVKN